MRFALNVERGSNNSREARRVDFVGLRTSDARIVSTHSSLTPGLSLLLRSWTLPVSRKRRCQSLIAVTRRLLIELCAVISLSLGD
jgi:hypothetical protein